MRGLRIATRLASRRALGQDYVEYGLLVAVVVVVLFVGLQVLMGTVGGYLGGVETRPNPTAVAALPNHAVDVSVVCQFPSAQVFTWTSVQCDLSVTDNTPPGSPPQPPTGSIDLTSSSGTFDTCPLAPVSGAMSTCRFNYTPVRSRQQDIIATYIPTSNHVSNYWQLQGPQTAINQTTTTLTCASSVPIGEPSVCQLTVLDLHYGAPLVDFFSGNPLPSVDVLLTSSPPAGGSATFTPRGQIAPQQSSPYACPAVGGVCEALFRTGVSAPDWATPARSVLATYPGDDVDYFGSNVGPVGVTVSAPTTHTIAVEFYNLSNGSNSCGPGDDSQNPLLVNAAGSAQCAFVVTDISDSVNPPPSGDPRDIVPSGSVAWGWSGSPGTSGNFVPQPACQLARFNEYIGYCQISYQPSMVGSEDGPNQTSMQTVQGQYTPEALHPSLASGAQVPPGCTAAQLSCSATVYVRDEHTVSVALNCAGGTSAAPLLVGQPNEYSQCIVTVTDTNPSDPQGNGTTVTPSGSIKLSMTAANGGNGAFYITDPATSSNPLVCVLTPVDSATANCQVNYLPSKAGAPPNGPNFTSRHMLQASYVSSDWYHPLSISNVVAPPATVFVK